VKQEGSTGGREQEADERGGTWRGRRSRSGIASWDSRIRCLRDVASATFTSFVLPSSRAASLSAVYLWYCDVTTRPCFWDLTFAFTTGNGARIFDFFFAIAPAVKRNGCQVIASWPRRSTVPALTLLSDPSQSMCHSAGIGCSRSSLGPLSLLLCCDGVRELSAAPPNGRRSPSRLQQCRSPGRLQQCKCSRCVTPHSAQ
jgi:hypothetical protein